MVLETFPLPKLFFTQWDIQFVGGGDGAQMYFWVSNAKKIQRFIEHSELIKFLQDQYDSSNLKDCGASLSICYYPKFSSLDNEANHVSILIPKILESRILTEVLGTRVLRVSKQKSWQKLDINGSPENETFYRHHVWDSVHRFIFPYLLNNRYDYLKMKQWMYEKSNPSPNDSPFFLQRNYFNPWRMESNSSWEFEPGFRNVREVNFSFYNQSDNLDFLNWLKFDEQDFMEDINDFTTKDSILNYYLPSFTVINLIKSYLITLPKFVPLDHQRWSPMPIGVRYSMI